MGEKKKGKNEKVIAQATISDIVIVFWLICGIIDFIIFCAMPQLFIILVPILIICVYQIVRARKIELYCTNKRVVGKTGVFFTQILDTPLNKVNNVAISKGIFCSNIEISSSSKQYVFNYIANAEELRNTLMEEIEKYEQAKIKEQAIEMAKAMQNSKI